MRCVSACCVRVTEVVQLLKLGENEVVVIRKICATELRAKN
jgi:hypothetical protein